MSATFAALGRRLGVERVVLSWYRLGQIVPGHQWCAEGTPELALTAGVPFDALPSWTRRLRAGEPVRYSDMSSLGDGEQIECRWARSAGIAAALTVPVRSGGRVLGGLSVHATQPRHWTDADEEAVAEVAHSLGTMADTDATTAADWRSLHFDALPVAMAAIDDHGELIAGNQAMRDIGRRPGEEPTKDDSVISDLLPHNRERLHAALRPVLAGQVSTASTVIDVLGGHVEVRYFQAPPDTGARAMAVAVPLATMVDVPTAADVPTALLHGWMQLHYQPVVEGEGEVVGAEALSRLVHPTVGAISPAQFVAIAEQTGSAPLLDRWVLEVGVADYHRLAAGSDRPDSFVLSVNLSADTVRTGIADYAIASARRHGIEPACVQFELTERAALHAEGGRDELKRLRSHGFRIALDDFGAGYSAVGYLAELDVDAVKLDRSLVTAAAAGGRAETVARAVCALADDLGLTIIAEGVETPSEQRMVHVLGCASWQGFLYGHAVPVGDFPQDHAARPSATAVPL